MSVMYIGWVIIPLMIFLSIKLEIPNFILLTLFTSFFTSTAVAYVEYLDLYIGLQQFMAGLLICKFIYELIIMKNIKYKNINVFLTLFILYASISIFIPLFFDKTDSYVIGVSSHMDFSPVRFSLSNITQLIYLLLGFIVYFTSYISVDSEYSRYEYFMDKFNYVILYSGISLGVLGIIQMFLNYKIFDLLFRHYNYNIQQVDFLSLVVNRPSGPTGEPSFYALALVPILCYVIYNFKIYIKKVNIYIYICYILTMILPLVVSKSSSFLIGIFLFIGILAILAINKFIKNFKNIKSSFLKSKRRGLILVGIAMFFIIVIAIVIYIINTDIFRDFLFKIKGGGVSGSERTIALMQHLQVFKDNFLFGVGFGSLRSKDLMSTWLAAMGIIGNTLFAIFLIKQLYQLFKINKSETVSLAILIIISWGILFISVPEPYYLYLWIYFAIADYVILNSNEKIYINKKLK